MIVNIGENGYVAISNIESDWGNPGASSAIILLNAISCSLNIQKERRVSKSLMAGRGAKESVQVDTNRTGSINIEAVPNSGLGYILRSALGDYYQSAKLVINGFTSNLANDVNQNENQIILTSTTGLNINDLLLIEDNNKSEIIKVININNEQITIERKLINGHQAGVNVKLVTAPFTHYFKRTNQVNLPSFTIYKSLGGSFGEDFLGTRINSLKLTFNNADNILIDIDCISKDYKFREKQNLLSNIESIRSELDPFIFEKGNIKKNEVYFGGINSGSLSITNNLQPKKYLGSGGKLSSNVSLQSNIQLTLNIDWEDDSILKDLLNDQSYSIELEFSHSSEIVSGINYSLKIEIPRLELFTAPFNLESGILATEITGQAMIDNIKNYDILLTLQDNYYSYSNE